MPKVEIMLQAPDAEALAQEFVKEAGADAGASIKRLPTRGMDAAAIVTMTATTIATAHILYTWCMSLRSRKRQFKCIVKVDGHPIEVEMPLPEFMKMFGK